MHQTICATQPALRVSPFDVLEELFLLRKAVRRNMVWHSFLNALKVTSPSFHAQYSPVTSTLYHHKQRFNLLDM